MLSAVHDRGAGRHSIVYIYAEMCTYVYTVCMYICVSVGLSDWWFASSIQKYKTRVHVFMYVCMSVHLYVGSRLEIPVLYLRTLAVFSFFALFISFNISFSLLFLWFSVCILPDSFGPFASPLYTHTHAVCAFLLCFWRFCFAFQISYGFQSFVWVCVCVYFVYEYGFCFFVLLFVCFCLPSFLSSLVFFLFHCFVSCVLFLFVWLCSYTFADAFGHAFFCAVIL